MTDMKDSYECLEVETTVSEMRNMTEGIQSQQTLQKKSPVLEDLMAETVQRDTRKGLRRVSPSATYSITA